MHVSLTPAEFAEIVAESVRDETGMLLLNIPDACIERDLPRIPLFRVRRPEVYDRLRGYLDSDDSARLTSQMRSVLQVLLHRESPVCTGDLVGVFRQRVPGAVPTDEAIRKFRTRINRILLPAGLAVTHSARSHEIGLELLS